MRFFLHLRRQWNQGATSPDGAYAENELNPDFLVAHRDDKLEYWVECKYRSSIPPKGFDLEEYQMTRYRSIQGKSRKKVLIALGVGGSPSAPQNFYVIPLDSLVRFKRIGPRFLPNYSLGNPRNGFRQHVYDWFHNEVFRKKEK